MNEVVWYLSNHFIHNLILQFSHDWVPELVGKF